MARRLAVLPERSVADFSASSLTDASVRSHEARARRISFGGAAGWQLTASGQFVAVSLGVRKASIHSDGVRLPPLGCTK